MSMERRHEVHGRFECITADDRRLEIKPSLHHYLIRAYRHNNLTRDVSSVELLW